MVVDRPFGFHLEAGRPVSTGDFDPTDETLVEMVQTVFPLNTDGVMLEWSGARLVLNYKYDISMMIDDVVILITHLDSNQHGEMIINWVSSGFPYRWEVNWVAPRLEIHSSPHDPSKTTLTGRELICDSIEGFTHKWNPVLNNIISAATLAGYDVSKLRNGEMLLYIMKRKRGA